MDVIYNKFYFGEVQEEVLSQRSGNDISARRKIGLSVCPGSVPDKNQAGWLRKCLCKHSTEVSMFVLEIMEKLKFTGSVIP